MNLMKRELKDLPIITSLSENSLESHEKRIERKNSLNYGIDMVEENLMKRELKGSSCKSASKRSSYWESHEKRIERCLEQPLGAPLSASLENLMKRELKDDHTVIGDWQWKERNLMKRELKEELQTRYQQSQNLRIS